MLVTAGCGGGATGDHDAGPRDAASSDAPARDSALDAAPGETSSPDATGRDAGPRDAALRDGPVDADAAPSSLVSIPLTGCTAGAYLAEVDLGGTQPFHLEIDTGSTTLAVAGASCSTCDVSPLYTPGKGAVNLHFPVSSLYGDGTDAGESGWSGDVYQDRVGIAGAAGTTVAVKFAVIESQSDFFYSIDCGGAILPFQGILGLSPLMNAIAGTDGYFDDLVRTTAMPDVFATELCDPGGMLWLGGYDPSYVTAPPAYTPYAVSIYDDYSYIVDMETVAVDGVSVDVPSSKYRDTILDTGNSEFFLPPAAHEAVTQAIVGDPAFAKAFPHAEPTFFSGQGECARTSMTKAELDATLPALTLGFGAGSSVSVTANATEAYIIPVGADQNVWCAALLALPPDASYPFVASLGAPILRSSVVIFDRAESRIGFAPHTACP